VLVTSFVGQRFAVLKVLAESVAAHYDSLGRAAILIGAPSNDRLVSPRSFLSFSRAAIRSSRGRVDACKQETVSYVRLIDYRGRCQNPLRGGGGA